MNSNMRKIMYIAISIICVVSIIFAVYYQLFAKKIVNEGDVNQTSNTINSENNVETAESLLKEFNKLFTNTFYKQKYSTENVKRIETLEDYEIVYTCYNIQQKEENKYEVDVKLPAINISSDVVNEFNGITQSVFADKTTAVLAGPEKHTIYNVEYVAYLNDNILSIAIKSTLKEGDNAQRVIIQTYNYDINTGKSLSLNDVLSQYKIATRDVNKIIEKQITQASKEAQAITDATGQVMYKRDLNSAIYATDNVTNFLVGKNGTIYIVYPYGNTNATSETDVIKIVH